MTNELQEPSAQPRTPKSWPLPGVALAATILLGKKVWAWVRNLGQVDDSIIHLLPLTPRYDSAKHSVYFDALDHALKSRKEPVLNVALTGSYGVGKSSILEELARRNSRKVTKISLSTLGFPDEADPKPGTAAEPTMTKTNRIQRRSSSNCFTARTRSRCRVHGTAE